MTPVMTQVMPLPVLGHTLVVPGLVTLIALPTLTIRVLVRFVLPMLISTGLGCA